MRGWLAEPQEHDYPAAEGYLSLLTEDAGRLVAALRRAKMTSRKAKDILRASGLPVLPADDPHVAKAVAALRAGTRLSPILLVRGRPLLIADGYHRVCASYHVEDDTEVPCKLA